MSTIEMRSILIQSSYFNLTIGSTRDSSIHELLITHNKSIVSSYPIPLKQPLPPSFPPPLPGKSFSLQAEQYPKLSPSRHNSLNGYLFVNAEP